MSERQTLSLEGTAVALRAGAPPVAALIARGLPQAMRERGETCALYAGLVAFLRVGQRSIGAHDAPPAARRAVGLR